MRSSWGAPAQSRLMFYSYLEKFLGRVLHYDTDSAIHVSKDGADQYEIPIGNFLGVLHKRVCFRGTLKNYDFEVVTLTDERHITCKAVGMRLDYNTSKLVNLRVMRNMVLGDIKDPRESPVQ
ncbi:hypothetical protein JTB14_001209 [Gonioctena quinquepunctata]|nr:hypothetical protein JTB14_001209 [Gonioctena quinquepunctata]